MVVTADWTGNAADAGWTEGAGTTEREPPMRVDYEFLNIRGQKMSTSRGRGAAAHEMADVLPAVQLRLLFLRPRPNQAIEFDPQGSDAIRASSTSSTAWQRRSPVVSSVASCRPTMTGSSP